MDKQLKCAICRDPIAREGNKYFPFCSSKCQMVDLSRWFNEEYTLPAPLTERDISTLEKALAEQERSDD